MKTIQTDLPEVLLIEPRVFEDERGFFLETYNAREFASAGIDAPFVQDNLSHSRHGVLRGVHYQLGHSQGKLVRAVAGEIYDVAIDLRRSSPHFGRATGFLLSAQNRRSAWIPPGFGHGFLVLSEFADVSYKVTAPRYENGERCLLWSDPSIAIAWPLDRLHVAAPIISPRDAAAGPLALAEVFD